MNKYYNKYIKYKLKYLKLMKGGQHTVSIDVYAFPTFDALREHIRTLGYDNFSLSINGNIIYTPCINIDQLAYIKFCDYIKYADFWYNAYDIDFNLNQEVFRFFSSTLTDSLNFSKFNSPLHELLNFCGVPVSNTNPVIDLTIECMNDSILKMYCDYMTSIHEGTKNKYAIHPGRPSEYFENIRILTKIRYSEDNKRLIEVIETLSDMETKVTAYMSTVKYLLDPITAKDSIKEIIKKCPWAIKGLSELESDIIDLFFETIFTNYETYLMHSDYKSHNFTIEYYRGIIPKRRLSTESVRRTIIEIIRLSEISNFKKYGLAIYYYALSETSLPSNFTEDERVKSNNLPNPPPLELFYIPNKITQQDGTRVPVTPQGMPIQFEILNQSRLAFIRKLKQELSAEQEDVIRKPQYYCEYKDGQNTYDIIIPFSQSVPINIYLGLNSRVYYLIDDIINSYFNLDCNNISLNIGLYNNKIVHATIQDIKIGEYISLYDCSINNINNWNLLKIKIKDCLDRNENFHIILKVSIFEDDLIYKKDMYCHSAHVVISTTELNTLRIQILSYFDSTLEYMGMSNLMKHLILNIMNDSNYIISSTLYSCNLQKKLCGIQFKEFEKTMESMNIILSGDDKNLLFNNIKESCGLISFLYRYFFTLNEDVTFELIRNWFNKSFSNSRLIQLIVYYHSFVNSIISSIKNHEWFKYYLLDLFDTGCKINFPTYDKEMSIVKKDFCINGRDHSLSKVTLADLDEA